MKDEDHARWVYREFIKVIRLITSDGIVKNLINANTYLPTMQYQRTGTLRLVFGVFTSKYIKTFYSDFVIT